MGKIKKASKKEEIYNEIKETLNRFGIGRVRFSACEYGEDGYPVRNNLFDVAVYGRVVVVSENGVVFSPVLNPTFLQLCDMANSAIGDGDVDHIFFEGFSEIQKNKYFTMIKLTMGS